MNIEELLNKGVAHQKKGQFKEALTAYGRVLSNVPDHPTP